MCETDSEISYKEFENRLHIVDSFSSSQSQKAMILYGNSRSGKSTIYCGWVFKEKYKVLQVNKAMYLEPKTIERRSLIISSSQEAFSQNSVTQLPNQHQILFNKQKILIVDCPGQNDSSKIRELINYRYIESTLKNIKNISFVIVLLVIDNKTQFNLDENQLIMLKRFMDLFPYYENSVSFVVNKFQCKNSEQITPRTLLLKKSLSDFFTKLPEQYKSLQRFYRIALTKINIMLLPFSKDQQYQIPKEILNLTQTAVYTPFKQALSSINIINNNSLDKQQEQLLYKKIKNYLQNAVNGFKDVSQKIIAVVKTVFEYLTKETQQNFIEQNIFKKVIQKEFAIFTEQKQKNLQVQANYLKSKLINHSKLEQTKKKHSQSSKHQKIEVEAEEDLSLKASIVKCAFKIESLEKCKVTTQRHEIINYILTYQNKLKQIFQCLHLFSSNMKQTYLKDTQQHLLKKFSQILFLLNSLLNDKKGHQVVNNKQFFFNNDQIGKKSDQIIATFNKASEFVAIFCQKEKNTSFQWKLSKKQNYQQIKFYKLLQEWVQICMGTQKKIQIKQILKNKKLLAQISIFLQENKFQMNKFKQLYSALNNPQVFYVKVKLLNRLAQYALEIKNYMVAVKLYDKIQKNSQVQKVILLMLKQLPATEERNGFINQIIQKLCQRCKFNQALAIYQAWNEIQISQFNVIRQNNFRIMQINQREYQHDLQLKYGEKLKRSKNLIELYGDLQETKLISFIQKLTETRVANELQNDMFKTPSKINLKKKFE